MSYDIVVFDLAKAPKNPNQWQAWLLNEVETAISSASPSDCAPHLVAWFQAMRQYFPAINGPHASAVPDALNWGDYSFSASAIHLSSGWKTCIDCYKYSVQYARQYNLGIFDISGPESLTWQLGQAGVYQVFHNLGFFAPYSEPHFVSQTHLAHHMLPMLQQKNQFLGIEDSHGNTLQTIVTAVAPLSFWIEIPTPAKGGSFGKTVTAVELTQIFTNLPEQFLPEAFAGFAFQGW